MLIDLTHSLYGGMPVYPGTLPPSFSQGNTIVKDGFAELNLSMCSHTGTHIDAPSHLFADRKSLDLFPIDQFIGRACIIDVVGMTEITREYLGKHEKRIAVAEFVILRSGWEDKWGQQEYFDAFPVMTLEAASWLAAFPLKGVGVDAISVDALAAEDLPNHRKFLGNDILIVENLAHLDKLPQDHFEFHCLPLKIAGADGSPVRACARI